MQPEFWHERWRKGQIGFHQSAIDQNLTRHFPELKVAHGTRVFVPLCGKSLDLKWLRSQGYPVVGVELSALALEAFCAENGVPARRRTKGQFEIYEDSQLELHCGDFFALTPADLGEVGCVYDRAALISWAQELREPYVRHLATLLRPGTPMLLVTMEYLQSQMPGPPFSLSAAEVQALYSPYYVIEPLGRRDILASEPRLRARGITELDEACYRLVRR
jgi:thiopurine S-methyltransferase